MRSDLNPEPDPQSEEKIAAINQLYQTAPERAAPGEARVSTDEMTGVHAREPNHPDRPRLPGQVLRREFEYLRPGTRSWIVNFQLAEATAGQVSAVPTPNEADLLAPIHRTVEAAPPIRQGHFMVDNLNPVLATSYIRSDLREKSLAQAARRE